MASSDDKKPGLQFEVDESLVETLDIVRGRLHASSRAEVLRRALFLLEFVTRFTLGSSSSKILLKNEDGTIEVLRIF